MTDFSPTGIWLPQHNGPKVINTGGQWGGWRVSVWGGWMCGPQVHRSVCAEFVHHGRNEVALDRGLPLDCGSQTVPSTSCTPRSQRIAPKRERYHTDCGPPPNLLKLQTVFCCAVWGSRCMSCVASRESVFRRMGSIHEGFFFRRSILQKPAGGRKVVRSPPTHPHHSFSGL